MSTSVDILVPCSMRVNFACVTCRAVTCRFISTDCLSDLLGIVESVLYAKRLPDALFNLAFHRASGEWPRQSAAVTAVIRANAQWLKEEDEQVTLVVGTCSVCLCA